MTTTLTTAEIASRLRAMPSPTRLAAAERLERLTAECDALRAAIVRHRERVWGCSGPVGHDEDEVLYAVLAGEMTDAEIDAAIASLRMACAMREAGYSTPAIDVTCALLLRSGWLREVNAELVEALRTVDGVCNGVQPGHGARANDLVDRLRPVARAALAKAEGRSDG